MSNVYGQAGPSEERPSVIHYAPRRGLLTGDEETSQLTIDVSRQALKRSIVRHFRVDNQNFELFQFLSEAKKLVLTKLQSELNRLNVIKFGLLLDTVFTNIEEETSNRGFISRNRTATETSDLEAVVEECIQELVLKITEHEARGSGWSLLSVVNMDLRVHKHGYGDRGSSFIPLPKAISNTKSCINVQNNDNECFRYAMLAKFLVNEGEKNVHRPNRRYKNLTGKYNFTGLTYPVPIQDITMFESRNIGVSVNVFGLDERKNVYPIKVVSQELRDHTDLLFIKEGDVSHYVFIKNFNKLVARQLTKKFPVTVCKRCFCFKYIAFNRGGRLWISEHLKLCGKNSPTKIVLPSPMKSTLKFNNIKQQYRIPVIIYGDFESTLIPLEAEDPDAPLNGKYQRHEPNSYCLLVKSHLTNEHLQQFGISTEPKLYRGEQAAKKFVDDLYEIAEKVSRLYRYVVPMEELSPLQELAHILSEDCYLCNGPFTEDNHKVHDHDHLTGEYRGAACNICNINYKLPHFIPVVLHNLSSYDCHFIIPELGRDKGTIYALAVTTERFISFSKTVSKIKLRFLDSLRFMPSSLSTLSKNLQKKDLVETKKLVPDDKLELVLRKGVFPYDYIDSPQRFEETSLPPRAAFYSKLNETPVTEEDYQHALKCWDTLGMSTIGEYSDFYVTLDVTLLCDVMEEFRNTCMEAYGLDPFHCYTSPGLAWQAMMKETKCELQLLTDIDMLLMVESGIRGGLTQSVTRYVKANNRHLPNFNPDEESVYIGYFDSNNLYAYSMGKPLPYADFSWKDPTTLGDILSLPKDGSTGYILDFDFEYPEELHDKHKELPLLPLSEIPPGKKQSKLLTTLTNKCNYVAHYWTVQQALTLGIKIVKVNRVLQFSQKCWLKPYMDSNTRRRTSATSAFQKDFFKLMNNSVYGKTLESKRNHMSLKLVSDAKKMEKLVQKPHFKTSIIINETLVAVCMNKTKIVMDRPVYVGMSVLDISKTHMYDFHYNKMVKHYGPDRIGIIYMDTDAYLYWIKTLDLYNDLKNFPHSNDFDFSDYPIDHPTYDNCVNKKVPGKFKDELCGVPLLEVVSLRSKMYALKILASGSKQDRIVKKAKGIKKNYVDKKLKFEHYYNCLFGDVGYEAKFNTIRSYNHQLYSTTVKKKSLSSADDKRVVMEDNVHTLPYGHRSLRNDFSME